MAEQSLPEVWPPWMRSPAGEGAGGQERRVASTEILDFDRYGALYGRFFLASVSERNIVSLIDPANNQRLLGLNFNELNANDMGKRDYNPVVEKFSLAERKEEWKAVPLFSEAYSQWQTKFTGFMQNIRDPQRERALQAILGNKKNANEFTADHADTLFEEFCNGKSDINNFLKRVTASLVNRGGEINPTYLHELLPHLQWIASGLFGKETASSIVTRLIELESALQNDFGGVMKSLESNKNRMTAPNAEEKSILDALHKTLVPQEKIPTQQVKSTIPAVPDVPKPAPVPGELGAVGEKDEEEPPPSPPPSAVPVSEEKSLEDMSLQELEGIRDEILSRFPKEDQGPLYGRISNMTERQYDNMTSEERAKLEKSPQELRLWIRRMDIANLRKILAEEDLNNAKPQVAKPVVSEEKGEEELIPGFVVIQIEGGRFRIKINGKDTGIKWSLDNDDGSYFANISEYNLVESGKFPESVDLPQGTGGYLSSKDFVPFKVRGGTGIEMPLSEGALVSIHLLDRLIPVFASLYDDMKPGEVTQVNNNAKIGLADLKKLLNQAPAASDAAQSKSDLCRQHRPQKQVPKGRL